MARLHFWMGLLVVVTAGAVMPAWAQGGEPDTTPPVITIIGGTEIAECGYPYLDPGATAFDAVDGDLAVSADQSQINEYLPGEYFVTYTAIDSRGNIGHATRTLNVIDTRPPDVQLIGPNVIQLPVERYFQDPGGVAWDQCEGPVSLIRLNDLDYSNPLQMQTLTYFAEDSSANIIWVFRQVVFCFDCGPCSNFHDFNQDGLFDDLFNDCNVPTWEYEVFGGSCARLVSGITWRATEHAEAYTATFSKHGSALESIRVIIPSEWRARDGFLVVSRSCNQHDLLSELEKNLGDAPDAEIAGNSWMFVAVCVADDDGHFKPLTDEQLASAPPRISVEGLAIHVDSLGYFAVADGTVEPDDDGVAALRVPVGSAWHSVASQYEAGTMTGTLTHLGVIGALERPLAPGRLRLSPNSAYDLLFGFVRVNGAPYSKTIRMSNAGELPMAVSVSRGGSSEFAVAVGSFTLGPGESREFTVTFHPSRIGEAVGQLVVFTEQDGPQAYTLRGVGLSWDDSHKGFLGCGRVPEGAGAAADLVVVLAALGVVTRARLRFSR